MDIVDDFLVNDVAIFIEKWHLPDRIRVKFFTNRVAFDVLNALMQCPLGQGLSLVLLPICHGVAPRLRNILAAPSVPPLP